jgi:hypothetical protein
LQFNFIESDQERKDRIREEEKRKEIMEVESNDGSIDREFEVQQLIKGFNVFGIVTEPQIFPNEILIMIMAWLFGYDKINFMIAMNMLTDNELRFSVIYNSYVQVLPNYRRLRMLKTCGLRPSLRVVEEAYKEWVYQMMQANSRTGVAHIENTFLERLTNHSRVLHDTENNMLIYQHCSPNSHASTLTSDMERLTYIFQNEIAEVKNIHGYQEEMIYWHFITIDFDGDTSLAGVVKGGLIANDNCNCSAFDRTHTHHLSRNGMCMIPTYSFDQDSLFFRCIMMTKPTKLTKKDPYVYESNGTTYRWDNGDMYTYRKMIYIVHYPSEYTSDQVRLTIITEEFPEEISLS